VARSPGGIADLFRAADRCRGHYSAVARSATFNEYAVINPKETGMAKGEQRGNRETKKPKKQKIKTIAAAPSQKTAGWQPSFASGKKK
jgi:hypothetical protein